MKCYHIDAFAERPFTGNPAAVCITDKPLPDTLMQHIAQENNLSETAFVVPQGKRYGLRWFTPTAEIDLCGHATLAAAYALANFHSPAQSDFIFDTLSGELLVKRCGERYAMNFPAYALNPIPNSEIISLALGIRPKGVWLGRDLVCLLNDENEVLSIQPDAQRLLELDGLLLHVTAVGRHDYDCVSRSFGVKVGVYEDPVCGSGHCHLAPFWQQRLGKSQLLAYQASARGGVLHCRASGNRVELAGSAVLYSIAELFI